MDFTGRPMKGYVMVDETGMRSKKDFDYFVGLCLSFNKIAKASKKKKQTFLLHLTISRLQILFFLKTDSIFDQHE
jgi:hypothetical protein